MAPVQLAGKTAPRLVQDIQLYDPAHDPATGRNLLSETPPVYSRGYKGPLEFISPKACKHAYVLKKDQTFLAQTEHRRRPGTSSKVSAMCSKCRCHLQVVVNYTSNVHMFNQTLKGEHMHHLVYKSGRQKNGLSMPEITNRGQEAETFHYQCSYTSCAAMVSLRILSPVLSPDFIHLMTDRESLRKRADQAIAAYRDTMEGMGPPEPISVLEILRLYITNALRNPQRSKSIAPGNKRFMHSFGVEGAACKELLEFLEFVYEEDTGVWHPPKPKPDAEKPYQDPLCGFLDDVVLELLALIQQRPGSEKRGSNFPDLPPSAIPDILYALEANDYPKSMRANEFQMADAPFYEDLGVTEDMCSSAIIEAYKKQVAGDASWMAPYYLTNLKRVGLARGGVDFEMIDRFVREEYAYGKYAVEDVEMAFAHFGLDFDDTRITDDQILQAFFSHRSSANHESQARRELWRIGDFRQSEPIKAAAEETVSTVEQANIYLGVENDTADDFVLSMYATKVSDVPAAKGLADRALQLIADHRNSPGLKHFIFTGETPASGMDISDAYRLLQIPDRTADEGAIMAAYTICIDENPQEIDKYNQALVLIANSMDSSQLRALAGLRTEPERNMQDWPVGLQNIGNTCYLNSLLQFYFSVRPFREMVLDFQTHQMDLDDEESLANKQVGSRKVSKKEVERSIRFLKELRNLYLSMITSSQTSVTPGQELARLTLISPSNEAAIRRRSTITAPRSQVLGNIDGAPILGPLGPPQPLLGGQMEHNPASDAVNLAPTASDASVAGSDATLVSDNSMNDAPGLFVEDKENNPPDLDDMASDQAEIGSDRADVGSDVDMATEADDVVPVEPELSKLPPAVPPRPAPEVDHEQQLKDELEYGAQQDVTEVINNVLFQSQCAIKARKIGKDGEQIDQIKDLFYGQTRSYITTEESTRHKEERWCDIKIDVAHGSRDIYDAIDGAFDVQKISVDGSVAEQYGSISQMPPVLQIQVQRVQFDPVKKTSFKSTNHLELLETIYMDRYMDSSDKEVVNRRSQCWEWKASLKALQARREALLRAKEADGLSAAALLRETQRRLLDVETLENETKLEPDFEGIGITPNLLGGLEQYAQKADDTLEEIDQQINDTQSMIANQFSDYDNLPYRLYAVFVHHGSVSFGHYYIYIFDFDKNIWRKYNDEYVTEVQNLDEIFKSDSTTNPPTPYFLCYVNSAMKERLASPVCREMNEMMTDVPDVPDRSTSPMGSIRFDPPSYDEASASKSTTDNDISPDATVNPLKRKSVDAEGNPTRSE